MRIFFSIMIFLAFATRPIMEMSTITYYQLNIDDIVQKYCVNKSRPTLRCNGKCYLMQQMKNTKSNTKNKSIAISETFVPLFFQDASALLDDFKIISEKRKKHWKRQYVVSSSYDSLIDHPPELIS